MKQQWIKLTTSSNNHYHLYQHYPSIRNRKNICYLLCLLLVLCSPSKFGVHARPFEHFETDNERSNNNLNLNKNGTTYYAGWKDLPLAKMFDYESPPRDAVQGTFRAIKTITKGTLLGMLAFVGYPAIFTYRNGNMKGLLIGLGAGVLSGVGLPLYSAILGFNQMISGIVKTPNAIKCRMKGQIYDEIEGKWHYYFIEQDLINVKAKIFQLRLQKRAKANQKSQTQQLHQHDQDFYAVLGIPMDATSSQIKKAYHQKAKKLHPDKNKNAIDSEDATNQFTTLRLAYDTLSDDHLRRAYDQTGETRLEKNENFDVHTFFPTILGLTPAIQKYIGDLKIVMFLDRVMLEQGIKREKVTNEIYTNMQTLREIQIGMHINDQILPYLNSTWNQDEFIEACITEAKELAKGEYSGVLLNTIGMALIIQSRIFLSTYTINPINYVSHISKRRLSSMQENWGITKKAFGVVKEGFKSTIKTVKVFEEKHHKKMGQEPMSEKSKREFAQLLAESMKHSIPTMVDLSLSIILKDISRTIQNACKKLFGDATIRETEWKQRAEAVQMMGNIFQQIGSKKVEESLKMNNQSIDDIIDQIEISYMISIKHVRTSESFVICIQLEPMVSQLF